MQIINRKSEREREKQKIVYQKLYHKIYLKRTELTKYHTSENKKIKMIICMILGRKSEIWKIRLNQNAKYSSKNKMVHQNVPIFKMKIKVINLIQKYWMTTAQEYQGWRILISMLQNQYIDGMEENQRMNENVSSPLQMIKCKEKFRKNHLLHFFSSNRGDDSGVSPSSSYPFSSSCVDVLNYIEPWSSVYHLRTTQIILFPLF